ncbi:HBL/NHE enterotoxin family protein [Amycolatopsis sp. NPDC051071]|uniref:HBL/NHE enterotoxin family protein n=1 Tax=Amycolatopsis sp. NPDC051071 TaxID=3154637 RepID=UPI0034291D25
MTTTAITKAVGAAKEHASNAVVVQSYALSAMNQPNVDFHEFKKLLPLQVKINNSVGVAKDSAHLYLNTVLPQAIKTIADIELYFQLHNALADSLQPGTSAQQAIALLKIVQEQAVEFQGQAGAVATQLQTLRDGFTTNSAAFNEYSRDLAAIVDGDHGVLKSLDDQLSGIDGKIGGAITGVVLSGLAIAGGVLMVGVGALAEPVTGGLSTALIIGGVAVAAAGIGGEVAASLTLAKLLDLKSNLLQEKAKLKAETTLAAGLRSGLGNLATAASSAATATQGMVNAWSLLGDDLGGLAKDVQKGQTTVDGLRLLFTHAAENAVKTTQQDIAIIKGQLTGVRTSVDTKATPGDLIRSHVAAAA